MGRIYPRLEKGKLSTSFQLVRINPSGGVKEETSSLPTVDCFQLVRINPSGGEALTELYKRIVYLKFPISPH